ncbi:MAG: hypothetical protein ACLGGV_05210 [Bacteroidia bacterium]
MIDNLKLEIRLQGNVNNFGKSVKKTRSIYFIPSPKNSEAKLRLQKWYLKNEDVTLLKISGSMRKWYLGEYTTRDLSYEQFKETISILSNETNILEKDLLTANVTKLELGFNLRFRQPMHGIINGFVNYKGREVLYFYRNESIRFGGDAFTIIFYDKFTQIMSEKTKKIKKCFRGYTQPVSREHLSGKLNKNNFCLRFEIGIKNKSKCPQLFKNKVCSPNKIIENWNKLLFGLGEVFNGVNFSEYNFVDVSTLVSNRGIKNLNILKTQAMVDCVGGIKNYVNIILSELKSNHRSEHIKSELELLDSPIFKENERVLNRMKKRKKLLFETKNNRINELQIRA